MCKPLRGKSYLDYYGYRIVILDDVKFAVEFYKKYRYDFLALKKDFPEIAKLWQKSVYLQPLNDWLFDYCFGE